MVFADGELEKVTIYDCTPEGNWICQANDEDNARLIAAAPELYEVAQDALAVIERQHPEPYIYRKFKENLRAAIAKVAG